MHIDVNVTRLWFDIDGPALVPDGSQLRQHPTVVLVHGGPGVYDHSYFKPDFARLTEHAQVIYLDLRGHGRSAWGDTAAWSLDTCADDIRAFCDTVGIDSPIVFGHSMGGPIVLLYGARHPEHARGLIVQSGFARWDHSRLLDNFRRVGGDQVAKIADRSYAGQDVPDQEWARVLAAFGPHLPDQCRHARTPKKPRAQHARHGSDPRPRHPRPAQPRQHPNPRVCRRARPRNAGRRRRRDHRRSRTLRLAGRPGPLLDDHHRLHPCHEHTRTRPDVTAPRRHIRQPAGIASTVDTKVATKIRGRPVPTRRTRC